MSAVPEKAVEAVARAFHETYETLAPQHGWTTQERSRVEWDEVPPENKALMLATVRALLDAGEVVWREEVEALRAELDCYKQAVEAMERAFCRVNSAPVDAALGSEALEHRATGAAIVRNALDAALGRARALARIQGEESG